MNTRCPPKRVSSAARFFTHCELTVQLPQSYSVGGQRSSGQLTGKPAGARPDYRGRWCAGYLTVIFKKGAYRFRGDPSNNFTPKRAANNLYRSYGAGAGLTSVRKGKLTSLKLPTSREVPKARDLSERDPEQISKLTEKNWNLYYVTPLYKFVYTGLKSYSRQLAAFILAEKQKGIAVEVGLETNFKVNFSIIQGLTEIEEDAEAVFLQFMSSHYMPGILTLLTESAFVMLPI
ncbi:UNVERIFIED_CONTAM: hypothetical protein FKN15_001022 [Acipenser sinensis]